MTLLLGIALLGLAAAALLALPHHLLAAAWPARAPVVALQLWQTCLLTSILALLGAGALLGLRPLRADVPHAVLAAADGRLPLRLDTPAGVVSLGLLVLVLTAALALLACLVLEIQQLRSTHRRQRQLLDLVAVDHPEWPGVAVLPHPLPVAYAFGGRHGRVVLTSGAFSELTPAEVRAVLAHERAHLQQRHHLVSFPYAALLRSRSRRARQAFDEVQGLLEMCADDAVRAGHPDWVLASALVRMSEAAAGFRPPPGAFAAADRRCTDRVVRLIDGSALPRWLSPLGHAVAIGLLTAPVAAIAVPCLLV